MATWKMHFRIYSESGFDDAVLSWRGDCVDETQPTQYSRTGIGFSTGVVVLWPIDEWLGDCIIQPSNNRKQTQGLRQVCDCSIIDISLVNVW